MDETHQEPVNPFRFIRRHLGRIVIGLILVAMVYGAMSVVLPYQREMRIAKRIEAIGGKVILKYRGPDWISQSIRGRLPIFNRIESIYLHSHSVPSNVFDELGNLKHLEVLDLKDAQISDAELEKLKGIKSLEWISLDNTKVTDEGLIHLKGLKHNENFLQLDFSNTKVTVDGRMSIRRELGCVVLPYP